ncbi:MAG TPA: ABC transporter permease subunit [Acidimicrobiia bacterium]|nr:ABC transporter permease subunit [Acidimicrobiia bacterium]
MRPGTIGVIARRDLHGFFATPLGYLVGVPFMFLTGWLFYSSLISSRSGELPSYFDNLHFLLLVTVPLVAMRVIAEESRTRSLDLLMVRPLSETEIVTGKWVAVVAVLAVLTGPLVPFLAFVLRASDPDLGVLGAQVASTVLLVAYLAALGVAASSLAQSQIAAAVAATSIGLIQWFADSASSALPSTLVNTVALRPHLAGFAYGLLSFNDVAFFVLWSAIWLVCARLVVVAVRR